MASDTTVDQSQKANALFMQGRLQEAEDAFAEVLAANPHHSNAAVQAGYVALLSNKFDEAENLLKQVLAQKSGDLMASQLLAEVYYRQDKFADAVPLLVATGQTLKAKLLEGFMGLQPYDISGVLDEPARLKFVQTDPIPVVRVVANGTEAHFIVDTGGSEVYLEPHFAERIGAVKVQDAQANTFAGGQAADIQFGRIDSLTLDNLTIKNVPVNILDTAFIGRDEVAKGLEISGFIGTVLLYHFLPTLDYVKGELVLRRKTAHSLHQLEETAKKEGYTEIPFWMAGDHFMVARGSAENSKPSLFMVDTGGAGLGFVPGPSFVKEAGIDVTADGKGRREQMAGMEVQHFSVKELSLGPLTEHDVAAAFGPFPQQMEQAFGFKIAAIISHEFFKYYIITIDFMHMRYFLRRRRHNRVLPVYSG